MHTYKMCVYISFIIFTTIENRWYFQTHYIAHARNMPSDCVKNSIRTYRNALKHTMDCQLFVWKHSRSRSLSLSLSLSLSFQISKHSLPKASFPSRTQDQKVLRSFQRSIFMPRSLQEGSTFMISQGEQAQFLSSARVS